ITFNSNQDAALLRTYGAEDGGVFVGAVKQGGPADKAGIVQEDVIVSINGTPIRSGDQLIEVVAATPVGKPVPVVIIRGGKRRTVDVTIADRAELFSSELGLATPDEKSSDEEPKVDLGISVGDMTDASREQLEYTGDPGL